MMCERRLFRLSLCVMMSGAVSTPSPCGVSRAAVGLRFNLTSVASIYPKNKERGWVGLVPKPPKGPPTEGNLGRPN